MPINISISPFVRNKSHQLKLMFNFHRSPDGLCKKILKDFSLNNVKNSQSFLKNAYDPFPTNQNWLANSNNEILQEEKDKVLNSGLDINDMLIMTFQAKKYLKTIGPNWKKIAELIAIDPIFLNLKITPELVANTFNFITFYEDQKDKLEENRQWKPSWSLEEYGITYDFAQSKMEAFNEEALNNKAKQQQQTFFDFSRYEELILEKPQPIFSQSQDQQEIEYNKFVNNIMKRLRQTHIIFPENRSIKIFKDIRTVLNKFQPNQSTVTLERNENSQIQPIRWEQVMEAARNWKFDQLNQTKQNGTKKSKNKISIESLQNSQIVQLLLQYHKEKKKI